MKLHIMSLLSLWVISKFSQNLLIPKSILCELLPLFSLFSRNNYSNSRKVSYFLKLSRTSYFIDEILRKIWFTQ